MIHVVLRDGEKSSTAFRCVWQANENPKPETRIVTHPRLTPPAATAMLRPHFALPCLRP
jgi:hypothetical protein